jgi:hypothetical protein
MNCRIRFAAVVCLMGAACGEGSAPGDLQVTRRDSSGITIVENPAAASQRSLRWRVDSVPNLVLGVTEGRDAYQFFHIGGVGVLASGEVFVLNAGTQQIRFFTSSGSFIRSVGGPGSGPGEYRIPILIRATTYDTLRILDFSGRLTWLSSNGDFVRSWTPTSFINDPVGFLSTDVLISGENSAQAGPDTPEGNVVNEVLFRSIHVLENRSDTLTTLRGPTLFLSNVSGRIAFTPVPFTAGPSAATNNRRLFISKVVPAEVMVFDSVGTLRAIYRVGRPVQPLAEVDFDRHAEIMIGRGKDAAERAELRRRYSGMTKPDVAPQSRRLLVDSSGHIWLESFVEAGEQTHTWTVMDSEGEVLGTIDTPPGLTVEQIGTDFLIGTSRDESDVERVARYVLRR